MNQTAPLFQELTLTASALAQYASYGGRELAQWQAELPGGEVLSVGRGIDRPPGGACDEALHVSLAVWLRADHSTRRAPNDAERDWTLEFLELPLVGSAEFNAPCQPLARHFYWPLKHDV